MPSYRFNQKNKYVAGSTTNRVKYECTHENCKGRMPPMACASTYARHYRSAHLGERPWVCRFTAECDFKTTRKTLLHSHYKLVHGSDRLEQKRQRGTLSTVPPPIEVEVDMAAGRRPSLTVKTDSASPPYFMSTMSLPTLPPVMNYSSPPPPPPLPFPAQTPQMQYGTPEPYVDYSGPMGSIPYPENTVYSVFSEQDSASHMSAYESATAINSAVPWAAWSTPTSTPPKPLYIQNWENALSSSSTPTSSPTPFPELTMDQNVYDPDLENILNGINHIKEYSPF
ncbi:hypothetical protein CALVIDRAFT_529603 [Calocera viscosa TUFC12733]|uniref:C2H2-type domain-containing protein n=1 Tax=Calocera viscosa (strain TUFC12733) TaxID=1330018 RepID=A0A167J224_CALVF|nr:hypothetical protein CALVIDRAFT_529603 [Calocera viscosa TUFC12733]